MLHHIANYRILRLLGQGGMGVVYAARDEVLERDVAVKVIHDGATDENSRKRFQREARAAASVRHSNTCQVYDTGEDAGTLYIVMELLQGQPLSERVAGGPLPLAEAVPIALGALAGLEALHDRGLVHRDLKPANIFLTPDAVKLVDFGLARSFELATGDETDTVLTQAGTIVGTPHYMSPEQVRGQTVDRRSDLFAIAAILFEMLAGRRVFGGQTAVEVLHAVLHDQPPALVGSSAIAAVDQVIRRALAKAPEERYATAATMAQDLRAALLLEDGGSMPTARAVTRLIVLPFRVLTPHPDIDFLGFSLADAVTSSLSGLESLVVRSSVTAAQFAGPAPDLKSLASQAEVDLAVLGTVVRAGTQLRVVSQLLEVPEGRVMWSHTAQAELLDLFQVQDAIVQRIVESLSASLTVREQRLLRRDVPASARAFELYLRANELSLDPTTWDLARQLYDRCLDEDPRYAPAWARLARIHRVTAKYMPERPAEDRLARAEAAFKRALDLNPDLSMAHNLYAHLEADVGRGLPAMLRLLDRARTGTADPDLFAGLVLTCRYCGLLEASVAADARATRLDPFVRTSVAYTHFMLGDYERAASKERDADGMMPAFAALSRPEAAERYREIEGKATRSVWRDAARLMRAALEGDRQLAVETASGVLHAGLSDPEARYYVARALAYCGEHADALRLVRDIVEDGFFCYPGFARDPWLDPLRLHADFGHVLRRAHERHREATEAFSAAGGRSILGLSNA